MADIALWNGDICALEVDAIVSPASTSLRMATRIAGAIMRRGRDAIELAAVRAELARSPRGSRVTFVLRGVAPYEAFRSALAAPLAQPARTLA